MSVSLIEWEGGPAEAGVIPPGARRTGKGALLIRPGQKSTLLLGHEEENGGRLRDGIRIEAEPNVGADESIIDVRLNVESQGEHPLALSTVLTLHSGVPHLVELGRVDGKALGVVIECTLIGTDGHPR